MNLLFTVDSRPIGRSDDMASPRTASTRDTTLRSLHAHVLRRCTFGPSADALDAIGDATPDELIEDLLAAAPTAVGDPGITLDDEDGDQYDLAINWWLDAMRSPESGLHERMVWFWHGHLTSSVEVAPPPFMVRQISLLREHAMGNVRTLLKEVTVDPAMLLWLDGADSSAEQPNENYSRELMELFTLGRDSGAYSEADVRAGARALAGWWIDWESGPHPDDVVVEFDPDRGPRRAIDFLGARVRTADDVVHTILDHPASAPFLAGRIHEFFVGRTPDDGRRAELGAVLRDADFEVGPLVASILRHESFLDSVGARPRSPLDWFLAAERLVDQTFEDWWPLEVLGQTPMSPPNVAGWPDPTRWVSGGAAVSKAQLAWDLAWDSETLPDDEPVDEILRRAVITDVSTTTRSTLDELADLDVGRRDRSTLLHAAVAASPEFNVS